MRRGALALCVALAACFSKPPQPQGGAGSDAAAGTIRYVKPIVAQESATQGFTAAADHAGDAIVVHVTCVNTKPSSIAITGAWTFTELGPLTSNGCCTTDSFGAVATSTTAAAFQVMTSEPCADMVILGDEFTGNDPTGARRRLTIRTRARAPLLA